MSNCFDAAGSQRGVHLSDFLMRKCVGKILRLIDRWAATIADTEW